MRRREFITLLGGATAAWPFSVRAQQSPLPVIGFMSARSPDDTGQVLQAFLKGLGEAGFFDGQNVTIEYRWARGENGRLPAFAAEFVQRRVNVLVATGGPASAVAAKQATQNRLPAVYQFREYALAGGLVSYAPSITDAYRQASQMAR